MKLPVEAIEKFFEAKFENMDPGPGLDLHHFDGRVHWEVWCIEDLLFFKADSEMEHGSSFPIVEFGIYCSHLSTATASGVGPVLILHSNNSREINRGVSLTKTKEGRISLAACMGTGPNFQSAERAKPT